MSKLQVLLVSLVAALPAGFLAFLVVMAFVNYGGGPNVMFQVINGLALLGTAGLALAPVGVLLFLDRSAAAPKPAPRKKADADEADDEEAEDLDADAVADSIVGDDDAEEVVDDDAEVVEDLEEEE